VRAHGKHLQSLLANGGEIDSLLGGTDPARCFTPTRVAWIERKLFRPEEAAARAHFQ
jgi:hypothetical protein